MPASNEALSLSSRNSCDMKRVFVGELPKLEMGSHTHFVLIGKPVGLWNPDLRNPKFRFHRFASLTERTPGSLLSSYRTQGRHGMGMW